MAILLGSVTKDEEPVPSVLPSESGRFSDQLAPRVQISGKALSRLTRRRSQLGAPSVEVALKKFPHPAGRIGGCLLVVFQPVTKYFPAGLELRVVETVVNAGVDDLLERHRSEEHTSELQSRENLVCRLLL